MSAFGGWRICAVLEMRSLAGGRTYLGYAGVALQGVEGFVDIFDDSGMFDADEVSGRDCVEGGGSRAKLGCLVGSGVHDWKGCLNSHSNWCKNL